MKTKLTEKQRIALYEKVQKELNGLVAAFKAMGDDVTVLDMFDRLFVPGYISEMINLSYTVLAAKVDDLYDENNDTYLYNHDGKKVSEAKYHQLSEKYRREAVKSVKNCQLLSEILEEDRIDNYQPPEGYKLVKITKKDK